MKLMRFEGTNKLAYNIRQFELRRPKSTVLVLCGNILLTPLTCHSMGLLGDDVQMVLARIEEAGNEGVQF